MSGPENGPEYARFPLTVKKGAVSAKWKYKADQGELPPESNPRFIFSVHSAWCNYAKSSNSLEVKLIRPEITKAEWQDVEGNSTSRGLVGQPLKLVAETKDMEGGVTFWIYDENRREVASLGADIVDGRAEAQWIPVDPRAVDDTRELRYNFEATGNRCKKVTGGEVQVRNPRVVSMEWEEDFAYPGDTVKLKVTSFEMTEFNFSGVLNFYDKQKFFNSEPLFSKDITLDADEKVVEAELPVDKLNMTYKDEAGFAKLCVEFMVKDINYSYIKKETLDILIDFERE